ncbi:MAG: hemolysin III family protein, partial [Gemmiger sp.]|nr:hemolysin III family protein [Gemmiger sp.]
VALQGPTGNRLLVLVWALALVGMVSKAIWVGCPKWFSSVIYIGMGWVCLLAFPQILARFSPGAFGWLLAGGIVYTVGGIIYALKLSLFNAKSPYFGSHEVFHLFVMGGSACHYLFMYHYLTLMGIGR